MHAAPLAVAGGASPEMPPAALVVLLLAIAATTLAAGLVVSRQLDDPRHPAGPGRFAWIDGLRGLAAMLVLLSHAPLIWRTLQLSPRAFVLDEAGLRLLGHLGAIGVQLFFCITGFLFVGKLMQAPQVDWTQFFLRRIRRLVPAYAVAVVLVLLLAMAVNPSIDLLDDAVAALPAMLSFGVYPLPAVGDFDTARLLGMNWTLAMEWRFYVMLPVLHALTRLLRLPVGLGIGAVAIGFATLAGPGVWVFFGVGAASALLRHVELPAHWLPLARTLTATVLLSTLLHWHSAADSPQIHGLHIALLFVGCTLTRPALLAARAPVALGTVSYSLYLLHLCVMFVVVGLTQVLVHDVTLLPQWALGLLLLAASAASVGMAAISHHVVERPFIDGGPPPPTGPGAVRPLRRSLARAAERPYS
jgi:peptidoglycan/LPS O-acetylase OafA/YrhL